MSKNESYQHMGKAQQLYHKQDIHLQVVKDEAVR